MSAAIKVFCRGRATASHRMMEFDDGDLSLLTSHSQAFLVIPKACVQELDAAHYRLNLLRGTNGSLGTTRIVITTIQVITAFSIRRSSRRGGWFSMLILRTKQTPVVTMSLTTRSSPIRRLVFGRPYFLDSGDLGVFFESDPPSDSPE